jgi:hypothetical protein
MEAQRVYDYMRFRAKEEGVPHELSLTWYQANFDFGIRGFFGVEISKTGKIIRDRQQPEILARYRAMPKTKWAAQAHTFGDSDRQSLVSALKAFRAASDDREPKDHALSLIDRYYHQLPPTARGWAAGILLLASMWVAPQDRMKATEGRNRSIDGLLRELEPVAA